MGQRYGSTINTLLKNKRLMTYKTLDVNANKPMQYKKL